MEQSLLFKKLNQEIELEVRREHLVNVYKTKLVDIGPESISVLAPKEEDRVIHFESGTRIKLLIPEGSVVFMLDSLVLGAKVEETMPLLVLQKPARMEKTQRRNNFRVPTEEFPVRARILHGTADEPVEGVCKEVSGGGMMLVLNTEVPEGGNLELWFKLPDDEEEFDVIGEVKRLEHLKRGSLFEYRLGIFFCNISDRMKEKIIKYTFRQQRKLIQRGLL